jgi:hypothetical protein
MAFQTTWFQTCLSESLIDEIERELIPLNSHSQSSVVRDKNGEEIENKDIRISSQVWVPTCHWLGGFLWYYISRTNQENFNYDLTGIDGDCLQYTIYEEGSFYDWHQDDGIHRATFPTGSLSTQSTGQEPLVKYKEVQRKLSFSLQLSVADSYEGGELQFLNLGPNQTSYLAPKEKGTLIIFDSRTYHRVRKIKKGTRKSLVGWAIGPRWK